MSRSIATLIHVLGADPQANGTIKTRSTIRTGVPKAGDHLSFTGTDHVRRHVTLVSVMHTERWSTILFAGSPDDLVWITTGTYIHAVEQGADDESARPDKPASRARDSDNSKTPGA